MLFFIFIWNTSEVISFAFTIIYMLMMKKVTLIRYS